MSHSNSNLKLGQFVVSNYVSIHESSRTVPIMNFTNNGNDDVSSYIISPLTQDEIADGWQLVLPGANKKKPLHNFSIYLSQLPHHLWHKLKHETFYGDDDKYIYKVLDEKTGQEVERVGYKSMSIYEDKYAIITDKIYSYYIKHSKHDKKVVKLYEEIMKDVPNKDVVRSLYNHLDKQRIKGWIMTRASQMI